MFGDLSDPQSQNRYVYCMNNPHKYVDPDGRIALQVGVSGNVGLGLGITGGAGTAFVLGRNGLETGTYSESGLGLFIGEALSGGGEFTITPFAMSLEDLEGTSINLGAKAAFGVQLGGLSISVGQNEDGSIDLWGLSVTVAIPGAGAGLEAAGTITWTETVINEDENLLPDNNDILMYCETSDTKSTMTGWDEYDKHRGV